MALRGTMIVLGVLFVLGTSGIAASEPESGPDPGNFVGRVDNPWFPLAPGTTFVYRGVKDGKSARDVFTAVPAVAGALMPNGFLEVDGRREEAVGVVVDHGASASCAARVIETCGADATATARCVDIGR